MTVKSARFLTAVLILLMVVGLKGVAWASEPVPGAEIPVNPDGKGLAQSGPKIIRNVKLWIGQKQALVNGESKNLDTAPMLYEDRTMVPLRFIAESLGADVQWDPAEQKIMIAAGHEGSGPAEKTQFDVILKIGQNQAFVNGKSKTLDVPPMLYEDRTMVPLRFIAEALGADVKYDSAEQCATIDLATVPSGPISKMPNWIWVESINPQSFDIPVNTIFTVTFGGCGSGSGAVQPGSDYDNIVLTDENTSSAVPIVKQINNNVLTIIPVASPGSAPLPPNSPKSLEVNHVNLAGDTLYSLDIPKKAVKDAATGNFLREDYHYEFLTESSLTVVNTEPSNNATNVPVSMIITVTFNKAVQSGSAYNNIVLRTGGSGNAIPIVKQISNNVLTITPTTNLAGNTNYIVGIPKFAMKDLAGNALTQACIFHFTTGTATTANKIPVPGAEITIEQIPTNSNNQEPAEKTQFGILKPINCQTNNKGEFSFSIPEEQFKKLPDEFSLQMTIIPPKGWTGISSSYEVTVKVEKSDGPKFEFVLLWQKEGDIKTNKGSFAINAKTQQ